METILRHAAPAHDLGAMRISVLQGQANLISLERTIRRPADLLERDPVSAIAFLASQERLTPGGMNVGHTGADLLEFCHLMPQLPLDDLSGDPLQPD